MAGGPRHYGLSHSGDQRPRAPLPGRARHGGEVQFLSALGLSPVCDQRIDAWLAQWLDLLIPEATPQAIADAVAGAVKSGRIWLVNGAISVLGEEALVLGFVNDTVQLFSPPLSAVNVLPAHLPTAWQDDAADAHRIHAALSVKAGKVLP